MNIITSNNENGWLAAKMKISIINVANVAMPKISMQPTMKWRRGGGEKHLAKIKLIMAASKSKCNVAAWLSQQW